MELFRQNKLKPIKSKLKWIKPWRKLSEFEHCILLYSTYGNRFERAIGLENERKPQTAEWKICLQPPRGASELNWTTGSLLNYSVVSDFKKFIEVTKSQMGAE